MESLTSNQGIVLGNGTSNRTPTCIEIDRKTSTSSGSKLVSNHHRKQPPPMVPNAATVATTAATGLNGSLSSTASSSGCSSVECSELFMDTTNIAKQQQQPQKTITSRSPDGVGSSLGEPDFLELNECLYLQHTNHQAAAAGPLHTVTGSGDDQVQLAPSMSEFSAFTLRKSIKNCMNKRQQQERKQHEEDGKRSCPKPRVRTGSSSTVAAPIRMGQTEADHHKMMVGSMLPQPSNCCCCDQCGRQAQVARHHSPSMATSNIKSQQNGLDQVGPIEDNNAEQAPSVGQHYWRRATMATTGRRRLATARKTWAARTGRHPIPQACTGRRAKLAPQMAATTTTTTMTVATLRHPQQAPLAAARRSLPVPPPVVPLYKELENRMSGPKLAPSGISGLYGVTGCGGYFKPFEMGGDSTTASQLPGVNILYGNNNNNYTQNSDGDTSNSQTNTNSGEEEAKKYYCDVWEDLRGGKPPLPLDPKSLEGSKEMEVEGGGANMGDDNSCGRVTNEGDLKPEGNCASDKEKQPGYTDMEAEVAPAVGSISSSSSSSTTSSTFTRRAAVKLLERLKFVGLLVAANFGSGAATSASSKAAAQEVPHAKTEEDGQPTSTVAASSKGSSSADKFREEILPAPPANETVSSSQRESPPSAIMPAPPEADSRIYDTPEFGNNQEWSVSGLEGATNVGRTSVRPSIPPPPPPQPHPPVSALPVLAPGKPMRLDGVRAPPPPSFSEGDCAKFDPTRGGFSRGRQTLPSRRFNQARENNKNNNNFMINDHWPLLETQNKSLVDNHKQLDSNNNTYNHHDHSEVRESETNNNNNNDDGHKGKAPTATNRSELSGFSNKKAVRWATIDDTTSNNRKLPETISSGQKKRHDESTYRKQRIHNEKLKLLALETETTSRISISISNNNHHHYQEPTKVQSKILLPPPPPPPPRSSKEAKGKHSSINVVVVNEKDKSSSSSSGRRRRTGSGSTCCYYCIDNRSVNDQKHQQQRQVRKSYNSSGAGSGSSCNGSNESGGNNINKISSPSTGGATSANNRQIDRLTELEGGREYAHLLKGPQISSSSKLLGPGNLATNWAGSNMGASHSSTTPPVAHKKGSGSSSSSSLALPTNNPAISAPKAVLKRPDETTKAGSKISTISGSSSGQASDGEHQQAKRKSQQSTMCLGIVNNKSSIENYSNNKQQQQQTIYTKVRCPIGRKTTTTTTTDLMPKLEDSIERRRKSIQDGDVFIYPTSYKNLNECQRCSRDNKICSCNNSNNNYEQIGSPEAKLSNNRQALSSSKTIIEYSPQPEVSCSSRNHSQVHDQVDDNVVLAKTRVGCSASGEEQIKSVSKISIATAPIDKKRHQLGLTIPRAIETTQPSPESIAIASSPTSSSSRTNKQVVASDNNDNSSKRTNRVNFLLDNQQQHQLETKQNVNCENLIINHERSNIIQIPTSSPMMAVSSTSVSGAIDSEKHETTTKCYQSTNSRTSTTTTTTTGARLTAATSKGYTTSGECSGSPEALDSNNSISGSNRKQCDRSQVAPININNKSHAKIIRKLIEERELYCEEQLTCNLSVGCDDDDSIKITSTSITIGCSQDGATNNDNQLISNPDNPTTTTTTSQSLASIIPIQTLSSRRRNLASKLSSQAIREDSRSPGPPSSSSSDADQLLNVNLVKELGRKLITLTKQIGLEEEEEEEVEEQDDERDELNIPRSLQAQDSCSSDALEYSPILTSVRDYIKNVNTAELQVHSPRAGLLGAPNGVELVGPIVARNSAAAATEFSGSDDQSLSSIRAHMAHHCGNIIIPKTIVTSTTGALTITNSSSLMTSAITSTTGSVAPSSFTTAKTSSGCLLIHQTGVCGSGSSGDGATDSPKKSIFEGASKDEILEYLEDARERVPEILMAADDVMVINENELIVVNQLEPGSPATPISIVEATEIDEIGEAGLVMPVDDPTSGRQLLVATPEPLIEHHHLYHHSPEELRQRLQQIYQQSSRGDGGESMVTQFSISGDNNNTSTMDEDTGISGCDQQSGLSSKLDSNRNSMETPTSPTELKLTGAAAAAAGDRQSVEKCFSSLSASSTVEDHHHQLMTSADRNSASAQNPHTTNITSLALFTMDPRQADAVGQMMIGPKEIEPLGHGGRDDIRGMPDGDADANKTAGNQQQGARFLNMDNTDEARRRNSTSSEGSNRVPASQISGNCTIQMLRLKHRYSNRDSLSSQSTSPPSSASPSSSTSSSNQTSGNCSAASTFYASSSLSCSSPFLALSATSNNIPLTLTSSSGAASQLTSHLSTIQQQQAAQIGASARYSDQYHDLHMLDPLLAIENNNTSLSLAECSAAPTADLANNLLSQVERDDSGLGADYMDRNQISVMTSTYGGHSLVLDPAMVVASSSSSDIKVSDREQAKLSNDLRDHDAIILSNSEVLEEAAATTTSIYSSTSDLILLDQTTMGARRSIDENINAAELPIPPILTETTSTTTTIDKLKMTPIAASSMVRFSSSANLMSRPVHGHYATMNRLNNYFMSRNPLNETSDTHTIEFQCLDCDQFIDVDQAIMMHKSNELRLLRETDHLSDVSNIIRAIGNGSEVPTIPTTVNCETSQVQSEKLMTTDQLDRAYIAAMNGLPLCSSCEKKRIERKEIISEFVETELKYGRDLKIIHDEFYRPMQIAGLLSKDQITGVFLNLEELVVAHCKFAIRLEAAIRDAHSMGDGAYNTVNIGRIFVESAEMLHTFESYCIRQGSAACLLARLAKEKELLRIFLRVSQMENTLLRRMNLAAFLMVPVQRVTKYPLLLNRLYKVTAYHHKDREVLRDAQLKVELHLEHINQQTKGVGATNKIWRRISNLSAPISNRRCLINAEDIGYIKLRKTAMDMLKWDRDETKFIHSGRLNFAPLNEFLIKQKMKPIRYMAAHALLIVLGKQNWKYRPDLVKSNLDNKLMTPTPGGNGVKEAALLLFREKGGRFIPCREPLFLSQCVLSADCSQYNSECPIISQPNHHNTNTNSNTNLQKPTTNAATSVSTANLSSSCGANQARKDCASNNCLRLSSSSATTNSESRVTNNDRSASTESAPAPLGLVGCSGGDGALRGRGSKSEVGGRIELRANSSCQSDSISMASIESLPDNPGGGSGGDAASSPPTHPTSRSYSLTSALAKTTALAATNSGSGSLSLSKSSSTSTSSNLTIINQLMTKVNSYGHSKQQHQAISGNSGSVGPKATSEQQQHKAVGLAATAKTTARANTESSGGSNVSSNPTRQHSTAMATFSGPVTVTAGNTNTNYSCPNSNPNNQNEMMIHPQYYNHLLFNNHHHHQPYGDYEESFEIHERLSKESMLLRADTPLKTRYWLQMLRYHAKDLGQWRARRNGLANIMMMRQD